MGRLVGVGIIVAVAVGFGVAIGTTVDATVGAAVAMGVVADLQAESKKTKTKKQNRTDKKEFFKTEDTKRHKETQRFLCGFLTLAYLVSACPAVLFCGIVFKYLSMRPIQHENFRQQARINVALQLIDRLFRRLHQRVRLGQCEPGRQRLDPLRAVHVR